MTHHSLGPVILDLKGHELDAEEREILQHPLVAGVIFFARNYDSPQQITELCRAIRSTRQSPISISVDHEGGRVQRFRKGFSTIPPMQQLGAYYETSPDAALAAAEACGWLIAAELLAVGVNLTFAPVLDLAGQNLSAIGDRAFHTDPAIVIQLAGAFIKGMRQVGMAATGKHFPGHGSVTLDSHKTMPQDNRRYEAIQVHDMLPFSSLSQQLGAIMPAHILFPEVDDKPVGFSSRWLRHILRQQCQFSGIIVSDDLSMEGAAFAGNYLDRANLALAAGCDVALICNNRPAAIQILDGLAQDQYLLSAEKVKILCHMPSMPDFNALKKGSEWQARAGILRERFAAAGLE